MMSAPACHPSIKRHPLAGLLRSRLTVRQEPFSLVHFVTERCNARCRHCFINFQKPLDPSTELSLDELRLLTKNLGRTLYNVNLTGGEPFLREDLFEIVNSYLNNTTVRSIVISSNGWFFDRIGAFIEQYKRLQTNCAITLSLSIDDVEEGHDKGRSLPGLYAKAIESYHAIQKCGDRRIKADIALTVTERNAERIVDIYHRLAANGVTDISPILFRAEGVQQGASDRNMIAAAYQKLTRLTHETSSPQGTGLAAVLHRGKNTLSHAILHDLCRNPRFISPCRAGSLFASIGADGTVAPCELLTARFPLGNLRDYDMNFLHIWNDKPARKARQAIRDRRCHCTFECAWTVNILTTPAWWPKLAVNAARELR